MLPEDGSAADLELELEQHFAQHLRPGDLIPSERQLAEQYGVSRHVLRTALQRLGNRGVISTRPGARSRLNAPSQAAAIAGGFLRRTRGTVGELYSARAVVESGAAAVLARRVAEGTVSKNELAALQAVLDELDALAWSHGRSTGAADFATALRRRDLDLDFHLGLVELVGNDFVTGVEHSLLAPLRAYPTLWREENAIASWQQEHRAILQAVRDGNAETAPGHVLYHLEKGRQRMNDEVIDEGANVHAAPRPTTTIGNLRTSLGREAAHVPDKSGT